MNSKTLQLARDILVNFTGAVLGIIVTFGTTAYINHQTKQNRYERIIFTTIQEIDNSIVSLEKEVIQLKQADSIYTRVVNLYPDHLNEISRDTLNLFIKELGNTRYFTTGGIANNIFQTNMSILEDIDNLSLVYSLYNSIAYINMLHTIIDGMQVTRAELFDAFYAQKHFNKYPDAVSAVKGALDIPQIYNYLLGGVHSSLCTALDDGIKKLKETNDNCKKLSGLSEKDIARLRQEYNYE